MDVPNADASINASILVLSWIRYQRVGNPLKFQEGIFLGIAQSWGRCCTPPTYIPDLALELSFVLYLECNNRKVAWKIMEDLSILLKSDPVSRIHGHSAMYLVAWISCWFLWLTWFFHNGLQVQVALMRHLRTIRLISMYPMNESRKHSLVVGERRERRISDQSIGP